MHDMGEIIGRKIAKMFVDGASKRSLADRFGVTLGGVNYWIRKCGIDSKYSPGRRKDTAEALEEKSEGYGCRRCGFTTLIPRDWGAHIFECRKERIRGELPWGS